LAGDGGGDEGLAALGEESDLSHYRLLRYLEIATSPDHLFDKSSRMITYWVVPFGRRVSVPRIGEPTRPGICATPSLPGNAGATRITMRGGALCGTVGTDI
jgi:hypothetical protein